MINQKFRFGKKKMYWVKKNVSTIEKGDLRKGDRKKVEKKNRVD